MIPIPEKQKIVTPIKEMRSIQQPQRGVLTSVSDRAAGLEVMARFESQDTKTNYDLPRE